MQTPFLTADKLKDIPYASDDSLILALITNDGAGKEIKRAALSELLEREREKENERIGHFGT